MVHLLCLYIHLLYLVEWSKDSGHLGKVEVVDANVAVQGDHTYHRTLLMQLPEEHVEDLLGDCLTPQAPQSQLV